MPWLKQAADDWFVVHDGLIAAARFPSLVRTHPRISTTEFVILLACGVAAALAVGFVKLSLGIPGHAIVLAALPMAAGLAVAPRRLAGSVMGAGACGTALLVAASGSATYGSGAIVSLSLLGPLMDVALRNAHRGWLVYAALVAAGVSANLLALGSRAATKVLGLDAGARPFDSWWLQAGMTYTLSGLVAGLLGALCLFHFNDQRGRRPQGVIYLGIDDTDIIGSPGTNQLARAIVTALGTVARKSIVCRHQLFFDPRIPYTSQNGSASIQLPFGDAMTRPALIDAVREVMLAWYIEGSDPGLAVAAAASEEMVAFAARAKIDVVDQVEARAIAERAGCHLEGLGGTEQGVIGALAAVALAAGGNDGRVVHFDEWPWPDQFCGLQPVPAILGRGVQEIRTPSGDAVSTGMVDVGKHLRPNWRSGRIVLLVGPGGEGAPWRALKPV